MVNIYFLSNREIIWWWYLVEKGIHAFLKIILLKMLINEIIFIDLLIDKIIYYLNYVLQQRQNVITIDMVCAAKQWLSTPSRLFLNDFIDLGTTKYKLFQTSWDQLDQDYLWDYFVDNYSIYWLGTSFRFLNLSI